MPPEKLAKVVNPVMKARLRSPLHRLVSRYLMLLTFAGRKTGRTYSVVAGRHEVDGKLIVPLGTMGRRWRLNFRGGFDEVELLIFPSEDSVDLILQIDRRARGLGSFLSEAIGTDESYAHLTIPEGATSTEVKEALAQNIRDRA